MTTAHVCDEKCPSMRLDDLPDTDDLLHALAAPAGGYRRVIVCHPVEADYVAECVVEALGSVDRVTCEQRDERGVTVHSDEQATTSVHATERVPAGKAFTWTAKTAVEKADRDRWSNAPGRRATPVPPERPHAVQEALAV